MTNSVAAPTLSKPHLDFLWLELTNRCNLQCTHCYAESGPTAEPGTISATQYLELITEAYALGCRQVQFIGGEPTLNPGLPLLIRAASKMGFKLIEVFTNLTRLSDELLECFVENRVCIATSVYGATDEVHDAVTQVSGSFVKTIANLRRVVGAGLPNRVAIIEMESNAGHTEATIAFLKRVGVQRVDPSKMRGVGRGAEACDAGDMSQLCGRCAGGSLCVSPTGEVSPCIMSKQWPVGSLSSESFASIAKGSRLREIRERIYDAVSAKIGRYDRHSSVASHGATCSPSFKTESCAPAFADDSCAPEIMRDARTMCPPAFESELGAPSFAREVHAACAPAFANDSCAPAVKREVGPSAERLVTITAASVKARR